MTDPNNTTPFSKPTGLLHRGTAHGSSRVGNKTRGSQWSREIRNPAGDLYDVEPSKSSGRVVHLETEPALGVGATLVFGYNSQIADEQTTLPVLPAHDTIREFAAFIQFGNGNGKFSVEVDIAEGTRLSVWGNDVEAYILDYSLIPAAGVEYWRLENMGASAYLPGRRGVKTQRCYFPIVVGPIPPAPDALQQAIDQMIAGLEALGSTAPVALSAAPPSFGDAAVPVVIAITGENFVPGDTEFVFTPGGPGGPFTLVGSVTGSTTATVVGTDGVWVGFPGGNPYTIRAQLVSNPAIGTDSAGPLISVTVGV